MIGEVIVSLLFSLYDKTNGVKRMRKKKSEIVKVDFENGQNVVSYTH